MNLNALPDDIRQTAIQLPYRVGLYISKSDQSGGSDSDEAEMAALANVVTFYVEDFCKSEFAQKVMLETLRKKADWPNWQGDIDGVLDDCQKVFNVLIDQLDKKEIIAFKNNLLEIAVAVAMAYREFDETDPVMHRWSIYLAALVDRFKAKLKGQELKSFDQMLNISRAEKAAINRLAEILDIDYTVG